MALASFRIRSRRSTKRCVALEKVTAQTPTTVEALLAQLAQDREAGLAWSAGYFETGVSSVAAPVFDATLDRLVSERVLGELLGRIGGRRAGLLFARRIPLLGGGVGGAMDGYSTIEIGGFARDVFITRRRITAG